MTKGMRQQMNNIQEQLNQQHQQTESKKKKRIDGDFIDYEEVK
jgi:hypothetical protein